MAVCATPPVRVKITIPCNGFYLRWYYNGFHYWYFLPGRITFLSEGEEYRRIGVRRIAMSSGQITTDQARAIKTLMFTREVSILTNAGWRSISIERSSIIVYDNQICGAEIDFIAIVGSRSISYTSGYSPFVTIPPSTEYSIKLGGLYNWFAINDARGIYAMGWHVPTNTDWETLGIYLGATVTFGYFDTPNIVGGRLKEAGFDYWSSPNTGAINDSRFTARGGGYRNGITGVFSALNSQGSFWANYAIGPSVYNVSMTYNSASFYNSYTTKQMGLSVRLVKNITSLLHGQIGTYTG